MRLSYLFFLKNIMLLFSSDRKVKLYFQLILPLGQRSNDTDMYMLCRLYLFSLKKRQESLPLCRNLLLTINKGAGIVPKESVLFINVIISLPLLPF